MTPDPLSTVSQLLAATVARAADRPALGTIVEGHLSWQTWAEVDFEVQRFAHALLQQGVQSGDRVAQIAENSAAWIFTDLALLLIGAVHVPMHVSTAAEQLHEQIADCEAKLVIVDTPDRINSVPSVLSHATLLAAQPPASTLQHQPSNTLATLLYTSGTTGRPRGVMLSHENLCTNAIATTDAVAAQTDDLRLCFLPLSHIYARTCDFYSWLYRGSRLVLAESRETILRDCRIVGPTVLNAVPYFYQKVIQGWPGEPVSSEQIDLRSILGGKVARCFCGGAAASLGVAVQFEEQGLPLLVGYGLTETSPVVSISTPENYRLGTVGRPLKGVEVRISSTGEVLVRGPNVMLGYWHNPTATKADLVDGWLQTGDLGEFDSAGNLCILGRSKELIVLATGKNVSPTRVEQRLAGSKLIEQVCVVGEGEKCLAALIVPNREALRAWIRKQRLLVWSRHRALNHPRVLQRYREEIDRLLADANREEQVGPFTLIGRAFSMEAGELTPKLSLCRKVLAERFADTISTMYR